MRVMGRYWTPFNGSRADSSHGPLARPKQHYDSSRASQDHYIRVLLGRAYCDAEIMNLMQPI